MQAGSQTKAESEDGNGKDGRAGDGIIWQKMPPADSEDTYNNNIDSRMLRRFSHNAYLDGLRSKRRRRAHKAVAPFDDVQGRFVGRPCRKPTSHSGTGLPSMPARRSSYTTMRGWPRLHNAPPMPVLALRHARQSPANVRAHRQRTRWKGPPRCCHPVAAAVGGAAPQ
jgi:hypothetical protein